MLPRSREKPAKEDYEQRVATEPGCAFFNAASVTPASRVDGIHLDDNQHLVLGRALVATVGPLLA